MKVSTGWLGQEHADVIDACFATALQVFREQDGRIQLLVDPSRVRTILVRHRKSERYGGARLRQIIEEVTEVLISWESNRAGVRGDDAKIIENRTDSIVMVGNRVTKKERPLWRVTIGSAWAKSMTKDILCRYDVSMMAALRSGISQAVARICLSHNRERWPDEGLHVDTVLEWLRVEGTQARVEAKRRIAADANGLARLGLMVGGGRICSLGQGGGREKQGTNTRSHGKNTRSMARIPGQWHEYPVP